MSGLNFFRLVHISPITNPCRMTCVGLAELHSEIGTRKNRIFVARLRMTVDCRIDTLTLLFVTVNAPVFFQQKVQKGLNPVQATELLVPSPIR